VSVRLNTRQVGDVVVVDVSGRITLGEGSSTLREGIRELLVEPEQFRSQKAGELAHLPDHVPAQETHQLGKLLGSCGRHPQCIVPEPARL